VFFKQTAFEVFSSNHILGGEEMSKSRIIFTIILLFLFVPNAFGGDIKHVKPEKVGLSGERLARIDKTMQTYADDRILPGAVILIARHGKK
jgi:hypothetical protein